MKKWKCLVCGQVFDGDKPPGVCPVCNAGSEEFTQLKEEKIDFVSEKKEKIVILGASVAALEAAKAIRERNKNAEIIMFTVENNLPYNRPGLSAFLGGDINFYKLFLEFPKYYEDNNIDIVLNEEAIKVDTDKKEIVFLSGRKETYDKLILACGASPAVPFKAVFNDKNVFSLRTLDDANKISEVIKTAKTAVIVGGGILGIEAAKALYERGLKITIVEYAKNIMGIQLDEKTSNMLRDNMENLGISIKTNMQVTNVENGLVDIKDSETLKADIVIICAGIKPNISLVEGSKVETDRGIIIDKKAKTSAENVFAAGDITQLDGKVTALWNNAINTGKAAGANTAGDNVFIKKEVPATVFNGFDTNIFSAGDIKEDEDAKILIREEKTNYKKIVLKNEKIVGGILVGDTKKGHEIINAINEARGTEKAREILE